MLNRSLKAAICITSFATIPMTLADEIPQKTGKSLFKKSIQAQSQGFLKDSKLNVLIRNFYINRDFRNSSHNSYHKATKKNGGKALQGLTNQVLLKSDWLWHRYYWHVWLST